MHPFLKNTWLKMYPRMTHHAFQKSFGRRHETKVKFQLSFQTALKRVEYEPGNLGASTAR